MEMFAMHFVSAIVVLVHVFPLETSTFQPSVEEQTLAQEFREFLVDPANPVQRRSIRGNGELSSTEALDESGKKISRRNAVAKRGRTDVVRVKRFLFPSSGSRSGCEWYPSICRMKNDLRRWQPEIRYLQYELRRLSNECNKILDNAKKANDNNKKIVDIFRDAVDVTYDIVVYVSYFSPIIPAAGSNRDLDQQITYMTSRMRDIELMMQRMQALMSLFVDVLVVMIFPSPASAVLALAGLGLTILVDVFTQKATRDKLRKVHGEASKALTQGRSSLATLKRECNTVRQNYDKTVKNCKSIVTSVKEFSELTREIFPGFHLILEPVNPSEISQSNILSLQNQIITFVEKDMVTKLKTSFQGIYNVTVDNIGPKLEMVKIIAPLVKEQRPIKDIFLSLPTSSSEISCLDTFRIIARLLPGKKCYYGYPLAEARANQEHFMYDVDITPTLVTLVTGLTAANTPLIGMRLKINRAINQRLTDNEILFLIAVVNPNLTEYAGRSLSSYPCRGMTGVTE